MAKNEKDHTILNKGEFNYKFTFDELVKFGDYIIDFKLFNISNLEGVIKCDSEQLVVLINNHYNKIEPIKRHSAKIIASNNPDLIKDGVKELFSWSLWGMIHSMMASDSARFHYLSIIELSISPLFYINKYNMKYLLILCLSSSCISIKKHNRLMKDYQILLYMDTVWVYDSKKLIGSFIHNWDSSWINPYDSIFIKDNQ